MANVSLNSLIFTPVAQNGASRDDAFLISSDDESNYSHLDEDQSDTSFPSIWELPLLARRGDNQSFSAASGASGDSDAKEPSVTDGADPDDGIASGWQQQTRGLEHSPAPPRPLSASPQPVQAECDQQGQLIPAGNPPCRAAQESDSDDTTCGKTAEMISCRFDARHSPGLRLSRSPSPWSRLLQIDQDPPNRTGNVPCEAGHIPDSDDATRDLLVQEITGASTLGRVAEQSPSSHRENTPCLEGEAEQSPWPQGEESPARESTPRLDATSQRDDLGGQHVQQSRTHLGGASDDGVGPPRAIPRSKWMRKTVHRTRFPDRPRDAHSDDDGLGQKSDDYGDSRDDTDGNSTDGDDRDSEEDYRPPLLEGSEGELDEEDDFGPPLSKRRKTVSAIPATPKTAATQRLRSSGPASQPREVQSPAHGGKRSSRRSIPSPPSSRASHDGKGAVGAVLARFEEWPLENVSLKRLQFSWDSCEHATESPRSESPVKKRNSAKRGATARAAITPDEDDLVIKLKEVDKLRWHEIHEKFTEAFPGRKRSVATLQLSTCYGLLHSLIL
ncbi:hypothetical protein QBC46DRAFT_461601 [Diplogelasinospora grovesii]|uniref:Myb-like domain-containing protein n=1 Tax=Diplogelasinospora grovesii TaxID=303347 RepID=A0AAN6MZ84_9PEZI|nr:hypothetical protein QBC46DRAFT_461601 [Diplogelasinospora grovesii]